MTGLERIETSMSWCLISAQNAPMAGSLALDVVVSEI
jgi:hypothetical protein